MSRQRSWPAWTVSRWRSSSPPGSWRLIDLARVKLAQQRPDEAAGFATQALTDFEAREDPRGFAAAYVCLGRSHLMRGDGPRGRALLEDALALCDRWGFPSLAREASRELDVAR